MPPLRQLAPVVPQVEEQVLPVNPYLQALQDVALVQARLQAGKGWEVGVGKKSGKRPTHWAKGASRRPADTPLRAAPATTPHATPARLTS